MGTAKVRLDRLLVERGLVGSRERAQAMILAGRVLIEEQKLTKPGIAVAGDAAVRLLGEDLRYVSRGGLKLERALQHWAVDLRDRGCVDVGASTGGFTDCMLQHGARSVLAVDTGFGQIAERLRREPGVRLMEKTNARLLTEGTLRAAAEEPVSFFAMDVSFISATLVLPAVVKALGGTEPWEGEAVVLVKPQFEAGREHVGKGGIVRDEAARQMAIERVRSAVLACEGREVEVVESPITGAEGNHEYLLHAFFGAR